MAKFKVGDVVIPIEETKDNLFTLATIENVQDSDYFVVCSDGFHYISPPYSFDKRWRLAEKADLLLYG